MPALTDAEHEAFRRLQAIARAVHRCEPSADGAVLSALGGRPDGRMPTGELLVALGWEKSRLSHHLTRMEHRGLVVREQCGKDLRAWNVVATDAGRAVGVAAGEARDAAIRQLLSAISARGEIAAPEPDETADHEGERHGGDGGDGRR